MTLNEMREWLVKRDIQLTRSLGQNFLHDQNQVRRIVAEAGMQRTDKILEGGPGLGPLTELLLEQAGEVLAIEMDGRLVEVLEDRFAADLERRDAKQEPDATRAKFELLHGDALGYLKDEPRDWSDWKLVANLPYSVASPILVELACGARSPQKIVATLQLEVAQRLMAQADDDDYGILTLLVQLDFHAERNGSRFLPRPVFFHRRTLIPHAWCWSAAPSPCCRKICGRIM